MSLYSALFAGVSGLSAEASAMAAVADNISNINTVGYKSVESQFSTMVGDARATSSYSAGGVAVAPRSLISKSGQLQASTSSTDLGIAGQGFFVTRTGVAANSPVVLTRAGSFAADDQGFLKNTSGLYLQGWRLDAQGGFTNTGSTEALEPIRLSDLSGTATATTQVNMRANFQNTTTTKTMAYAAGDMATGDTPADLSIPFDVYDAQGGTHQLKLSVMKRGPNEWVGEIYAVPASDVTAANGLLASGTIKFNADGSLDLAGSTAANTANGGTDFFAPLTPSWTNGAGALPINLGLGSNGGMNGFTQFGSASAPGDKSIDGGLLGNVASVNISESGIVSAVFDNGTTRAVFQLPVATVPNPDGLTRVNGNAYTASDKSGSFTINKPGSLGAGQVQGFTLEASTADLAQEFTNMIRFQRAYSASSKIITTVDDMLQEVSNLKR